VTEEAAEDAGRSFEPHRRHLTGLAYRMLGSLAGAEDVVQEAYVRWHATDRKRVQSPRAFLSRAVTRLSLDELKSARSRRENYVGPWLPEPVLDDEAMAVEAQSEYADDLSVALLLTLERLSPLERAAFLLHDVFDLSFVEIAETLERSEAACRQLAARAREHVRSSRPRFRRSGEEGAELVAAFRQAVEAGDVAALAKFLARDAVLLTDGGGKRAAALNPIYGADRIIRFLAGVARKGGPVRLKAARINGLPGLIVAEADGQVATMAYETHEGEITAIYVVRNPDKLRRIVF
jgi:RNA polymerase sigma-70 factor, ECF subfamily